MFTPELDLTNWPLILASYKVDFISQIFYGKDVEIRTHVSRIGNSSFETYQQVWQQGKLCAEGTATMVRFDYASQKAVAIEPTIREQLMSHFIDLSKK